MSKLVKPAPRVRPRIAKPRATDAQKVNLTEALSPLIQASPHYAGAPALVAAVTGWKQCTDTVSKNQTAMVTLRDQLRTLVATQRTARNQWVEAMKLVTANVEVLADGDATVAQSFGFDAVVPGAHVALMAPTAFTSKPGLVSGEAVVTWTLGVKVRGFVVQHATDVTNPATYSTPVVCTRRRYTLTGASPASTVSVHVATIDPSYPTGLTAWSEWIAVKAR